MGIPVYFKGSKKECFDYFNSEESKNLEFDTFSMIKALSELDGDLFDRITKRSKIIYNKQKNMKKTKEVKNKKDVFLAGILSFLVPGLGQVYVGKVSRGIIWFAVVVIGYFCLIIPGIILWIASICDAVEQAKEQ